MEDWAALQDQLADKGQTLDQHEAERRQELTALREEGGLHTSVALDGLRKLPVWRGTRDRGERLDQRRFCARYVKDGDTFRPRNPTFTWKTITSISKSQSTIEGLSVSRREREVAPLPGATFAYGPIEVMTVGNYIEDFGDVPWAIRIKAKQIR